MESTSDSLWAGADVSHDTAVVVASKKPKSRKTPRKRANSDDHTWLKPWHFRTNSKPKRNSNTQPWLACTQDEAKPYKKYKKLYGERKFARDFSTQKQKLSFSDDLPAEVRLQVYQYLFNVPDNFFEFWAPKAWAPKADHCAKNSFRQFAYRKKALGVMRLCRKIHEEVSDYFYGGNNFRFSYVNGFLVMAAFNHTIKSSNFSFLKHITVQIPNRVHDSSYHQEVLNSKTGWQNFDQLLARRGMRIPDYRIRVHRGKKSFLVQGDGWYTYDQAVRNGFRQLRRMPNLKLLEITIPWDYEFLSGDIHYRRLTPEEEATQCHCPIDKVEAMSPEDRIWHTIEEHCEDPDYLKSLADLKENTASEDLTIALVIHYGTLLSYPRQLFYKPDKLRQARWIAAYAAVMGYAFGHARWERKGPDRGTYQVSYDEDPILAFVPEDQEENSLLEPPMLPGQEENPPLKGPKLPEYQVEEVVEEEEAEATELPA